ncbi:MAG: RluA family pseudouridine synthase, partial [Rhodobacteraceae bacterium]|nr:RluA family pseudouridine synthase [Paracoccaceae bacterium]
HRLDMDTSGLMVFAMTPDAQRNLGRQFEKRVVEKEYIARVEGVVTEDTGTIDLPLIVDWPNRPLQKVDHEHGKPAQTAWRILERAGDSAVLSLRPKTGRSHQLRVHMREIGHPILGDRFYGSATGVSAAPRLLLHSYRLDLIHPETGERVAFSAPCPFFATEG